MRLKKQKNMGRRNNGGGGGGGGGGRSLQFALRRRVESCKSKYTTAEEIVDHLRSNYPDYHRTKSQQLLRFVNDALQSSNNTPSRNPNQNNNAAVDDDDDDDEEECRNSSRKRRKDVTDESEARLQKMEALHIKTRMSKEVPSSSSEPPSDSGDDGAVSTSEDAIYSEKVEPAFDLMKDMLRNSYTGAKTAPVAEEKNVELDMGNSSKDTITVNKNGGESKLYRTTKIRLKGSGSGSNVAGGGVADVEMKGKEGPMFKDLGGMKDILEELMMDIVSLCNPQLPRHLGVKPVTGILLHGPPGCGKTRLAHAIANETGLPFHHISATEVVSGVSGIAATFQL
jgi:ribosome biogenesis ATPase